MNIPEITFKTRIGDDQTLGGGCSIGGKWKKITTNELFHNKKIVLFSLPGAYTPTCSSQQLPGYDQYDIQYPEYNQYDDPDYFFTETDYTSAKPEFTKGIEAIEKIIGSRCYRLRYSTLEPGAVLDWHMDQPTLDRFIIVLSGKQRYEVMKRGEPHHIVQEPLDVWYINASWEHRVLNMQNEIRVALLGCFVYNKG